MILGCLSMRIFKIYSTGWGIFCIKICSVFRCPGPQDTIQRLPRLMPFITALYLDNSSFYNFRFQITVFSVKSSSYQYKFLFPRIFGEEISSLKVVSACNCGIADFSGVDFLVNLKELYVANNAVENVFELSDLLNIEVVDLEGWALEEGEIRDKQLS